MEEREKIRKCYKRPQIHHVKLEITEAVLSACKSTTIMTTKRAGVTCSATGACKDQAIMGS